jgi:hypothetical protein
VDFKGLEEREKIISEKAAERLRKSQERDAAAQKQVDDQLALEEKRRKKRLERALQNGANEETWEEREKREAAERESRKAKHKEEILKSAAKLPASIAKSLEDFNATKGVNAPEPVRDEYVPFKAGEDPAAVSREIILRDPYCDRARYCVQVAARMKREQEAIEAAKKRAEEQRTHRAKNKVTPDPAAAAILERTEALKAKAEEKLRAKQQAEEEEERKRKEAEKKHFEELLKIELKPPKPTAAQIARSIEVFVNHSVYFIFELSFRFNEKKTKRFNQRS